MERRTTWETSKKHLKQLAREFSNALGGDNDTVDLSGSSLEIRGTSLSPDEEILLQAAKAIEYQATQLLECQRRILGWNK